MSAKDPDEYAAEEFAALSAEQQAAAWARRIEIERDRIRSLTTLEPDYDWWRKQYQRRIDVAQKRRDDCLKKV